LAAIASDGCSRLAPRPGRCRHTAALEFPRARSEVMLTVQDLTLSEQVAAVLKVGISDHIHCVVESHSDQDLLTSEQMAQKMGADYQGLVPVLTTELPEGFFISVGYRCDVSDRQFVHLVLKYDDKVVSVVITEKDGLNFPVCGTRVSNVKADGITLHHDRLQSFEPFLGTALTGHDANEAPHPTAPRQYLRTSFDWSRHSATDDWVRKLWHPS
jgi:hypothetical protein